ncbi:hypothetical protein Tco_1532994 [Tanacetum coccineum]
MAQQQHAADVHPDELCPPNKRYDLMDANKKIDFEQVQCPPESKLLTNIIKNHPLRFSIAASSSVPWIYMAQFWHTLKEDGSKYRLTFMLDKKELSLTLDDFRTIFHLPQATDNNHDSFVPPPSFLDMVPFYKNELGFTMELKTSSSFKTTGLLQPWKTLCKIFFKCLTTRTLAIPRNDDQNIPDTRLEPRSDKESPKVEITNVVIPVNVNEEEEEITDEVYELKRREKGKIELQGRYGYLFEHLRAKFLSRKSFDTLADHLQEVMVESLPTMGRPSLMSFLPEGENRCRSGRRHSSTKYNRPEIRLNRMMINYQRSKYPQDHYWKKSVTDYYGRQKLKKIADEMLRQRCTSGDERQYHIDPDEEIFLKSDIVGKAERNSAYLLYLKKGNSGPEKIVLVQLSPVFLQLISMMLISEERTSKWEINRAGKPKEVDYSNITDHSSLSRTYWELGDEHKFNPQRYFKESQKSA